MKEARRATAVITYTYERKKYVMYQTFTEEFGKSLDTQLLVWIESLVMSGASIKKITRFWN